MVFLLYKKQRKLYLEKCINVIDYANEKLQGIGLYDLKCGSLFLLEKYDEVNELCEKVLANKYYDEDKESILRYYIFVNIHRYINSWDKNNEGEEVEYLTKMAKHIDEISIDKMDAYKQYVPVISLYNKMNVNDKIRNNIIEGLFALLLQVNVIKNKLLYENDKQEFGYYTTLNSIKYLLEDDQENRMHRISVFDARHMNDPNEGKILIDFLNKDNNISSKETDRRRISYENEYVFLKSFTTKVDSLPMWVQYSDDGKGCFISVKSETFTEGQNLVYSKQEKEIREMLIEDEYQIYRVAYFDGQNFTTSDGICITEQIENLKKLYEKVYEVYEENSIGEENKRKNLDEVVNVILSRLKYLIKKDDYKNEDEIRILFLRTGREEDVEYTNATGDQFPKLFVRMKVPVKIREVILGPKVRNGKDSSAYIYKKLEGENITVSQSTIEYV